MISTKQLIDKIMNEKYYPIYFIVMLSMVFYYLDYYHIIVLHPQGIHFWRQTDSIALSFQFYNNGFNFFAPASYNLSSIDGKAACDFPLYYYLASFTYFFGKNFWALKLLHFITLYIGIYYVYKITYHFVQDFIYSVLVCLFILGSTIMNYYAMNVVPDIASLGLIFCGLYYVITSFEHSKSKTLIIGIGLLTLSSLVKINYMLYLIAVLCFSLYTIIFNVVDLDKKHMTKVFYISLLGVLITIGWYIYVVAYNHYFDSTLFATKMYPMWDYTKEQLQYTLGLINVSWKSSILPKFSLYILYIMIVINVVFFKKHNKTLFLLSFISFLGLVCYTILEFPKFDDHDYYFLTFFPLIILISISFFVIMNKLIKFKSIHYMFKVFMCIVTISGIVYSKNKLNLRYIESYNMYNKVAFVLDRNKKNIDDLNLPQDAKCIVFPDYTPNGGLLFLDRMGWPMSKEEFSKNRIMNFKDNGATYFISVLNDSYYKTEIEAIGHIIFENEEVFVAKL